MAATERTFNPLRDLDEKLVARSMAKCVIDLLEVIEIEQEECSLAAVFAATVERIVQHLAEESPVGEACQRIVIGQLLKLAVTYADLAERGIEALNELPDFVIARGL